MAELTMVEAVNRTLHAEMERDDRVVVFGEDVGINGGVFRATEGLVDRFGARRVMDMPLAEAVILGSAVGLAAGGMVPVPEIQFLGFTYQGFHQLAGQIARLRFRSHGRFEVPITIRAPFGGGVRTPELHSDSLEGQLANLTGMKLVAPATAADMAGLLRAAIRDPDPVLVLEPLRGYRGVRDEVPDDDHVVPLGSARVAREGSDVAVIAWSYQVQVALRAAETLAGEGISCHVVDLRSLVPLDLNAVGAAVERCGRLVVVEEAAPTGGFAGEVITTACEEAFWSLEAPPVRVSGYDAPYPLGMLEDRYVPDADRIATAVRGLAEMTV